MRGLQLIRDIFTDNNTEGRLIYDGKPLEFDGKQVYTLEDVARPDDVKIKSKTAIPHGDYRLTITFSQRFGRLMPLIYNKEDNGTQYVISGTKRWDGIRQHTGNTDADTEGCQLVGFSRNDAGVYSSRDAFKPYFDWLTDELKKYSDKSMPYKIINQQS